MHTITSFLNPEYLIIHFGLIGVWSAIFAESGILIGIVLPGDSLLFTAGLLSSQGFFSIKYLVVGSILAAIIGDSVGYAIGKKSGDVFFKRDESIFFKREYADRAKSFFEKHGTRAVIFARFIPIIRTLTPTVAGIGKMPYRKFLTYNIIGGIGWAGTVSILGYFLGKYIPHIDSYLIPIILLIIVISFIPVLLEIRRSRN